MGHGFPILLLPSFQHAGRIECDERGVKRTFNFQTFGESDDLGISEDSDMKPPKELIIPLEALS